MFWLTWRQHRWQLAGVAVVLSAYCAYLATVGAKVRDALSGCPDVAVAPPPCIEAFNTVNDDYNGVIQILILAHALPVLVGMFWGAPLIAREIEHGTHRMIFTQSVSRGRWLTIKLGVLTAAAALAGAATGVFVRWSFAAFAPAEPPNPFDDRTFGLMSLAAAAAWVFSLITGVTASIVVRRTMPAIALTLVVTLAVIACLPLLRAHYAQPAVAVIDAHHADEMIIGVPTDTYPTARWRGNKIVKVTYSDSSDRQLSASAAGALCADPQNSTPTPDCLRAKQLRQHVEYQPGDRFWRFQLTDAAILLTISAVMFTLMRWLLFHRLA